ncbi:GH1 family beta-glucosidase [Actinokineospora globicatena]|uniref:GH1 family beta-glucosidase n=1 Tax=Actinokineospora globicatena TaxID=103729 RepID=UPI0020A30CEE|nr:GH1 family beta-glucosidase [Actinokineospora globicatena]MCP2303494.1 broad-specificity cellobiase [Actinokineospora globicatena]GLW79372.1 beta-glucosidase [Actinokineospora globicatena]GLW86218.1 beta-glucosidase [Actinokineospora globicatena]
MVGDQVFPPGFLWGAATAAYQIEGAVADDGRRPSIWDAFAAVPGAVEGGASGATACDHYHRYSEDVALLGELGLGAYRFSTAWPRVMPDGRTPNAAGLAFYDRLVDSLLEYSITPVLTLYHWDLPQALQDRGGWLERDIASWFAEYATTVHNRLGDRVQHWTTLNEPFCSAFLGYGNGVHAPGLRDPRGALRAAHHHLLAHGHAARALRANGATSVSIALNFSPALPDGPDDHDAVRRFDAVHNRFFLDPVLGHGYPTDLLDDLAHLDGLEPAVHDGDLAVIAEPVDWLGVNYYAPTRVTSLADPTEPSNCPLPGLRGMSVLPPRAPLTVTGWEQHPDSLTDLLVHLSKRCGIPLVVAENGAAFPDVVDPDGRVRDTDRVRYFAEHLRAVHAAIEAGADVRGYLAWSLLDNFEWASGYGPRFGVVHVDFASQRRTIKDSGRFLAQVAARNAVPGGHLG